MKNLQNSYSIRGVASEGIIGEPVTLTDEKVTALGHAFAAWLKKRKGTDRLLRIAIATDCRISGPHIVSLLEKAVNDEGCDSLHCGLCSTPAIALSTVMKEVAADGSIMVTVSGNQMIWNKNGLQFYVDGSIITPEDMTEVIGIATEGRYGNEQKKGTAHIFNLQMVYADKLNDMVRREIGGERPLEGLKIIVDVGNGSGSFYVTRVLEALGADVSGSQFMNPDGRFPNHASNPEDYEAILSLSTAVRDNQADLGIIFDSDVDRAGFITSDGKVIGRNELVAIASAIVLADHPNTTVVSDSICSTGVTTFITDVLHGTHHRFQRGYRNIINEAKRLNAEGQATFLAVETSGHAAFGDNNFVDDGAYLATRIIIKLAQLKREGKHLNSLIEQLPVPAQSYEFRLPITEKDFRRIATETLDALRLYISYIDGWTPVSKNYEGVRVLCDNDDEKGWFLFRLSLHDPVMPLNVESEIAGGADAICKKLKLFFRNVRYVDSGKLYV